MSRSVHFRRCHVCGFINDKQGDKVERCHECGKSLAAFFYFDDRLTATLSDTHPRPPLLEDEYFPIQGLTVYWESF